MHWIVRYCAALLLSVWPCLSAQAAEVLDEEVREQLLQLKQFCDEGLIDAAVCKEKQRQILGLPQTESASVDTLSETSGEEQTLETERGFLGVIVEPVSAETRAELRLPAGEGAAVARVLEDSPADLAGVTSGDVIVKLGDQVVRSADLFAELEAALTPGAKVPLKVLRNAGEEIVLDAAVVDRREYPPARTHASPFGFSITLPAGWTIAHSTDFKPIFDAFTQQLGKYPQTSKILGHAKKLTEAMETYAIGNTSVSAMNHDITLPTTPSAIQEMCAKLAAIKSKMVSLGVQIDDCGLRTIGGSRVLCMDQDASSQKKNMKMRHCWIKKPSQGNLKLTLTFENKDEEASVNDFEKMMASLSFLDQGEADQEEKDNGEDMGIP